MLVIFNQGPIMKKKKHSSQQGKVIVLKVMKMSQHNNTKADL